jgi:3-hydroxyacyl-CoA dehydrogenase/3a,7a,12a-trihydroxy-5b-cholest-24-enoyl-CoA hydratase
MRVTHAAWPILREKNYGRIIVTASSAGIYGNFGQANYSAAKIGLVGFAQTLAEEGRAKNIHVNAIAPVAASRLTETVMPQEILQLLKPEAVTPLVAWLCHENCEETKGVFEVGAGFVGKLRWERSEGVYFPSNRPFTLDDVAAKWSKVVDFSGNNSHIGTPAESVSTILDGAAQPRLGGNEFIDLDEASKDVIEAESSYDERDLSLYALGVGAARDALDPKELPFVYELGDGFQALPTYAVMPAVNTYLNLARDGRTIKGLNYGLDRLLHGEQYTELLRPLPPHAKLKHVVRFKTAYDKDPNAVVILAVDTLDENGEKLAYNEITNFVRGAGGWGGDRGPSGEANTPPAREPDAVIEEQTDPNQTLLYRLSGDWNPLHADPNFAKAFGFDKPILHGLCTYGFVGRHVLKAFANNDGRKFKSIKVRFAKSVFPGETLVTRMWKESDQRIVFETRIKERDELAISHAAVEFYAEIPQAKANAIAQPAAQPAAAPAAPATPTTADIFKVIEKHFALNKGLGDQIKTVFQFKLKDPDSDWVIDLKSGDGTVQSGTTDKPDATLELSNNDWLAMSTGQADPTKLYFGGKLKITGNIMATQKLTFLQKIDPKLLESVLAERASAPAPAQSSAPAASAPAASTATGRASSIFASLKARFAADAKAAGGLAGRVVQFHLREPAADWVLDFSGAKPSVESGRAPKADATFTLDDADLADLTGGKAQAHDLYQRGRLRVDGDVLLARELDRFHTLLSSNSKPRAVEAV